MEFLDPESLLLARRLKCIAYWLVVDVAIVADCSSVVVETKSFRDRVRWATELLRATSSGDVETALQQVVVTLKQLSNMVVLL
eukprot:2718036-Amphidinium_carterae.1